MTTGLFYGVVENVQKTVGDEDSPWTFEVVASTDTLDKDGEIIDPAAIRMMKAVERVPFCVSVPHEEARMNPVAQIGWAYPIVDTPDNVFKARVELWPDHSLAADYWAVLQRTWPEQKVSIGGELGRPKTIEYREGRRVRRIHDIRLDHILAVRGPAAANPDTRIELDMRKSLFKTADEIYGDRPVEEDSPVKEDMWDETAESLELQAEAQEFVVEDADDLSKASIEVSNKPWDITGYAKKLPASCFLYVPDPDRKSTWKFPVFEGEDYDKESGMYRRRGALNWHALRNAAARLVAIMNRIKEARGFETMTIEEARQLVREVGPKIVALYKKIGKPVPAALAQFDSKRGGKTTMTVFEKFLDVVRNMVAISKDSVTTEEEVSEEAMAAEALVEAASETSQDENATEKTEVDVVERLSALEQRVGQLADAIQAIAAGLSEKSDIEEEEKTEEKTEEEVEDEEQKKEASTEEEVSSMTEAIKAALQPLLDRLVSVEQAVETLGKSRGVSLQVSKAELPSADDNAGSDLRAWELALREIANNRP